MCVLTCMIDAIACYWITFFFFHEDVSSFFSWIMKAQCSWAVLEAVQAVVVKWAVNTHYKHGLLHFCCFLTWEPENPSLTTGPPPHPLVWSGSNADSRPSREFGVILAASSLRALQRPHFLSGTDWYSKVSMLLPSSFCFCFPCFFKKKKRHFS